MDLIARINQTIFGPALFFCVFGAGLFFLFRTRFFFIAHPIKTARAVFMGGKKEERAVSPFAALCTALAGTLGVGNIVGVAGAVSLGGPGALFWMWASALAAMVLKYAEVVLGVKWREKRAGEIHGGAAYYIKNALGNAAMSRLFAVLCVAASFTLGNAVQSRAAADAAKLTLGVPPAVTGAVTAAICLAVTFGGLHSIAAFTTRLIPALTAVFIVMSVVSISAAAEKIPAVLAEVMRGAFSPSAAFGGIAGALFSRSVRYGIARGIASNEAGCGTAPTAHAAADTDSPVRQGLWGIIEVAVDTVVLCTLTALVILVNGTAGAGDGIAPVLSGFSAFFGRASDLAVCLCVFFLALSTVLCWSYYGAEAVRFLTPRRVWEKLYLAAFFALIIPFSVLDTTVLWELSDLVVSLMTAINVPVLISQSRDIAKMTAGFFGTGQKSRRSVPEETPRRL